MARLARLYAPATPQLARVIFADALAQPADPTPADALDHLHDWLLKGVQEHRIALHGWVILPDQLVLLATPPHASALSKTIQGIGRRMAMAQADKRPGPVFTGRYRSALVEPGRWVLPALVWLESLPTRLGHVDTPTRWPWSSAQEHVGQTTPRTALVTDHPDYWQCGNTPFARQANYKDHLQTGLTPATLTRIETALQGQWVLGDEPFLSDISDRASRRVAPAPRGRPRKTPLQD